MNKIIENTKNTNSNISIHALIDILIIFINSGFALTTGHSNVILFITIIYLLLEWCIRGIKVESRDNGIFFLVLFILFIMISCVINFDFENYKEYLRIFVLLILAYHYTITYKLKEISIVFCRIMSICCIMSLVFFAMVSILPNLPYPIVTNGYGVRYYTLFVTSINESIAGYMVRNSGPFWEAGMYAAFIMVWQIIYMYIVKGPKQIITGIIAIITILTTKSTSGYIYIIFIIVLLIISNKNKLKFWQSAVLLSTVFLGIFAYINKDWIINALVQWKPETFSKLILNNASVTDRINNPLADLYIAIENPLGVGVGDLTQLSSQIAMDFFAIELTSRTSTLTYYFAAFGIPCGIMVCNSLLRFIKYTIPSMEAKIIIFCSIVILCTSTPLNLNLMFLILLFYGMSNFNERKLIDK